MASEIILFPCLFALFGFIVAPFDDTAPKGENGLGAKPSAHDAES